MKKSTKVPVTSTYPNGAGKSYNAASVTAHIKYPSAVPTPTSTVAALGVTPGATTCLTCSTLITAIGKQRIQKA
jgi:hypothetical protein